MLEQMAKYKTKNRPNTAFYFTITELHIRHRNIIIQVLFFLNFLFFFTFEKIYPSKALKLRNEMFFSLHLVSCS